MQVSEVFIASQHPIQVQSQWKSFCHEPRHGQNRYIGYGMQRAKIGNGSIQLNGIEWPISDSNSIWIDQLNVKLGELSAEPGSLFETLQGPGNFEAVISDSALFAMIAQAVEPRAKLVSLTLPDGYLDLEIDIPVAITSFKGNLRCKLAVVSQQEIAVELVEAKILGVGATTFVNSLLKSINPVFQAKYLPYPATIESVTISGGELRIQISLLAGGQPQEIQKENS